MSTGEKADFIFRGNDACRKALALSIPLLAFFLQWYFWETIQPYVWFLFFPAVFFSSWLGGMRAGFVSTVFSTLVVWWFFMPPQYSFFLERPGALIPIVVFACMGVIFSLTHERLRKVNRQATTALAAVEAARDHLEERVKERTADLSLAFEELLESEGKYRRTLDSMLEGCQIIGFDWRYQYLNDTADKHNRRPKKELLGKTVMECWPGITETRVFALEKSCMEDRLIHRMENEFTFPDGSIGWFRLIIQPVTEGIAIYSEDISERKQVEAEVIALNNRLHHLITAIKELASAHTLEDVQHIVSVSARKLTGADGATMVFREGDFCYYADEDAIGPLWKGKKFPLTSCISGWVMLNNTPAFIADIYADERIPVAAYRPTFVKSLTMVPVNTDQPVAAIGNYWRDIHTPSEMEIQLLQTLADAAARAVENVRLLEELEQRVRLRTAQLENANKELEAFSYSVSHDLKAPLRGIDGYSRLLEEDYQDRLDEEALHFLRNIRQGAAKMHELIEDLLNYSRMERRSLQRVSLDLSGLIQAVLAERAEELKQSGTRLSVDIPAVSVNADRDGLTIVLRNLLENALKFSVGSKPPTIEMGARAGGNSVILFVRDNGIGFDMKFHDRIFEIFQRLQRAEDFPGTGVGLALVRKAMQRMGGRAWAESSPGEGATFYLEIPT